jgi:predicted ABC-type ATPase
MGFLLVVTGPPGAGKSTVAQILAESFDPSVLVQGDAFFAFLARGAIEPWLPESGPQNEIVVRAAAAATGRFVAGGYATVYDGVLGPWYVAEFATAAGVGELQYVILLPPVERCVRQVETRSGHGFRDEAATRHMHAEFARSAVGARHVLTDPAGPPRAVAADILARLDAGALRYP